MATYKGSCHCGQTKFTAEGELKEVISCNCSMCRRRGGLLWFLPAESFHLETPRTNFKTYLFNKRVLEHHFYPSCGIATFSEGSKGGQKMVAVNARCLEGVDPDKLEVKHVDRAAV